MKTVIGIFNDFENADEAIDELKQIGYKPKDFSIVMKDREDAQKLRESSGATVADSTMTGVATGAAIGGLTGLLIGIGAIAIPGLGALLVGGPLAAALGLTGAAATTLSGAATGAVAGGLIGALMGLGLSRDEAATYEERVKEGGILLAVPTTNDRADEVRSVLEEYDSTDIKMIDADDAFETHRSAHMGHNHSHNHTHHAARNTDEHDIRKEESEERETSPVRMQKYLQAVDYPATKDDLIETAEERGADDEVLETLNELPEKEFESPTEVSKAIRHTH